MVLKPTILVAQIPILGLVVLILLLALAIVGLLFWTTLSKYRDTKSRLETRKEQFSVLAHEIKTPLALISATTELILGEGPGDLTGDQRVFLNEIDYSVARMGLLADNILTESKLQAGVFTPSFAPTDVREIIREVCRSMRRLADKRGQRIALDYPQMLDSVMVDASLIRQAMTNLVQNALRHTSKGGIVALRAFQNDAEVVISVWDDGAGMSPQERKAVFRQFVSNAGGTGLGLTIVETIAALHNGTVSVDTSLGQGAAFFFRIPRSGT